MKKLNKLLLVAFILGVIYMLYSVVYWSGTVGGADSSGAELGSALAFSIVGPHLTVSAIAVVFNALGLFMKKRAFALTAGILYAVAMVLFPMYFFFVVIQAILCFIGFARMKNNDDDKHTTGAHSA